MYQPVLYSFARSAEKNSENENFSSFRTFYCTLQACSAAQSILQANISDENVSAFHSVSKESSSVACLPSSNFALPLRSLSVPSSLSPSLSLAFSLGLAFARPRAHYFILSLLFSVGEEQQKLSRQIICASTSHLTNLSALIGGAEPRHS